MDIGRVCSSIVCMRVYVCVCVLVCVCAWVFVDMVVHVISTVTVRVRIIHVSPITPSRGAASVEKDKAQSTVRLHISLTHPRTNTQKRPPPATSKSHACRSTPDRPTCSHETDYILHSTGRGVQSTAVMSQNKKKRLIGKNEVHFTLSERLFHHAVAK